MLPGTERIPELICESVRRRCEGKDVAISFSGGVDSGLVGALAMRYAKSAVFYVAGTPGSHDVEAAKSAAETLDAEIRTILVDPDDAAGIVRSQMEVTGTVNPLILAFTSPIYCVLSRCEEDTVLAGQGADEVFGGYGKYVSIPDSELKQAMKADADRFFRETFPHEEKIAARFGKTVERPYLDPGIVSAVSVLPPETIRPSPEDRKRILCDAARELGFGFLADRPKKAAQYGSGILDAVKRYCRSRGIEYNALVAEYASELRSSRFGYQLITVGQNSYNQPSNIR